MLDNEFPNIVPRVKVPVTRRSIFAVKRTALSENTPTVRVGYPSLALGSANLEASNENKPRSVWIFRSARIILEVACPSMSDQPKKATPSRWRSLSMCFPHLN